MLRGLRAEKTNKMASEITFVGEEEIQFLSSVSLPNLRQALGENFLDSDSVDMRIVQVIPMIAVRIFQKNPVAKMRQTCRTMISPLNRRNVSRAKKGVELRKNQLKANRSTIKEKLQLNVTETQI